MRPQTPLPLARCSLLAAVLLALPALAAAQETPPAGQVPQAGIQHTLVYHERTAFTAGANDGGEQAPILSDDGQHIAFAQAPGTEDPATPNRIFVMTADGAGQHQVDAYPTLCGCGSAIDISADGAKVVSTDSVQLRIADGNGGNGRELLALDSGELNAVRISGDGAEVFFRVYRDTSVRGSSPSKPIQRGIWVINADGSEMRQLVGPTEVAPLLEVPADQVPPFGASFGLDASTDGSQLVFGMFIAPQPGGEGQGLFAVTGSGGAPRKLLGRVSFVNNAAISGDGATAAYTIVDAGGQEVGIIPVGGGSSQVLLDNKTPHTVANGGFPASDDRMQLSADGTKLLLGSSGVLADTTNGDLLALGVPATSLVPGAAPLVVDGLFRATMDRSASRMLYIAGDAKGVRQLATVDVDPPGIGDAPRLSDVQVAPEMEQEKSGSSATVRAQVGAPGGRVVGVGAVVLRNGLMDQDAGVVALFDDGTNGDSTAGDGMFTNAGLRTNCCAVVGPRVVRIEVEEQGADGMRRATAVDVAPFAVVGA